MTCPRCRANLVEIRLAGPGLTLRSCSNCDGRWWTRDGEPLGRGDVMAQVASARRRVGAGRSG